MTSWLLPLIGMSLAAWSFYDSGLFPKVKEEVCDTPACNYVSTIIRNSMNTSIDPCDDFHEFVCGNRKSIQSSQSIYKKYEPTGPQFTSLADYLLRDELASEPSPDDILPVKQMKKFYKSCMNLEARRSEGLQRILDEFQKTGGWQSNMTWQEIDRHYEDLLGLNAIYTLGTGYEAVTFARPNHLGSLFELPRRANIPYLMRPALREFTRLMNATLSNQERDALEKVREQIAENWPEKGLIGDYMKVHKLAEYWRATVDPLLTSNSSSIDWATIFQRLSEKTNRTIHENTQALYIYGKSYEKHGQYWAALLQQSRTLVHQVQWNFLLEMMPYVNLEEMENIIPLLVDLEIVKKSWLTDCLLKDEPIAMYLLGRKYNGSNEKIDTMYRNTLESYKRVMNNISSWYEKSHVWIKRNHLGYDYQCRKWKDCEADLIDYYKDLTIGDSYVENMFSLKKIKWIEALKYVKKSVPSIIASKISNLPISSYDESLPDYYGYSHVMPTVISRGLSGKMSKKGLNENFMTFQSSCYFHDKYLHRAKISNLFALKAAWQAYKEMKQKKYPHGEMKLPELSEFTDEQMFFISYAQTKCDSDEILNAELSHTAMFTDAFHCKNTSKMNPEKRCDVSGFLQE